VGKFKSKQASKPSQWRDKQEKKKAEVQPTANY
jgi:hypothetical protein